MKCFIMKGNNKYKMLNYERWLKIYNAQIWKVIKNKQMLNYERLLKYTVLLNSFLDIKKAIMKIHKSIFKKNYIK